MVFYCPLHFFSVFCNSPLQVKNCDMTDSKPIVNLVSEVGHIMLNVLEKVRNRHFSYFPQSFIRTATNLFGRKKREYTTNKKTN